MKARAQLTLKATLNTLVTKTGLRVQGPGIMDKNMEAATLY